MDKGLIDGLCLGSPWNALAVDRRTGVILALPADAGLLRNGADPAP